MKRVKYILLFLLLNIPLPGFSQQQTGILQQLKEKLSRVNDYAVDVTIKIDVPFLKIKERTATLYYKRPDKIRLKASGFALIPKASLNFSPANLFTQNFIPVFVRRDSLNGQINDVYKLVPTSENSKFILLTIWIDHQNVTITRLDAATAENGNFTVEFKYSSQIQYALPDTAVFRFDLPARKFPHFPGMEEENQKQTDQQKRISGKVIIQYRNYRVNIGLKDDFFREEESEELD